MTTIKLLKMKKIVLSLALITFLFSGCKENIEPDFDRKVIVNFITPSLSSSLLKSTATQAEIDINKIILFGLDLDGKVVKIPDIINTSGSTELSISIKIKTLFAIANPSALMESATPADLAALNGMTAIYSTAPQSYLLMSGKGDIVGNTANIALIRAVAKIEIVSGDTDFFVIEKVQVRNTPNQGYVFQRATVVLPSTTTSNYTEVTTATPVLYVAENTSTNANQTIFRVTGKYLDKTVTEDIILKHSNQNINIVRNTHYKVQINPATNGAFTIVITIPNWGEGGTFPYDLN